MKKTREEILEIIKASSEQGQPIKVTKIIGNLVKRAYLEATIKQDLDLGTIVKTEREEYMTKEAYARYKEAKQDKYDKTYNYIMYTDKQEKIVRKMVELYYQNQRPISTTELGVALGYRYEEATYRVALGVKAGFEHGRIEKIEKNFYVPVECYSKEWKKYTNELKKRQIAEQKEKEERKKQAKLKRQQTLQANRQRLNKDTTTTTKKIRSYEELSLTQLKKKGV